MNIFYVLMGFLGIYQWKFGGKEKKDLPITQLSVNQNVMIIVGGLVLTFIFGFIFEEFTEAEKTYLDSFTTAFAIFATFMTIQKKLDNWIYWIIVDVLYVYIYGMQGAVLFMALYFIYCIIAIRGFFEWRRSISEMNWFENYVQNLSDFPGKQKKILTVDSKWNKTARTNNLSHDL